MSLLMGLVSGSRPGWSVIVTDFTPVEPPDPLHLLELGQNYFSVDSAFSQR